LAASCGFEEPAGAAETADAAIAKRARKAAARRVTGPFYEGA
jgi:hypothetical protein